MNEEAKDLNLKILEFLEENRFFIGHFIYQKNQNTLIILFLLLIVKVCILKLKTILKSLIILDQEI